MKRVLVFGIMVLAIVLSGVGFAASESTIDYVVKSGLMARDKDGDFKADQIVPPTQFAQVLFNLYGEKNKTEGTVSEAEAPKGKWYSGAASWYLLNFEKIDAKNRWEGIYITHTILASLEKELELKLGVEIPDHKYGKGVTKYEQYPYFVTRGELAEWITKLAFLEERVFLFGGKLTKQEIENAKVVKAAKAEGLKVEVCTDGEHGRNMAKFTNKSGKVLTFEVYQPEGAECKCNCNCGCGSCVCKPKKDGAFELWISYEKGGKTVNRRISSGVQIEDFLKRFAKDKH